LGSQEPVQTTSCSRVAGADLEGLLEKGDRPPLEVCLAEKSPQVSWMRAVEVQLKEGTGFLEGLSRQLRAL
jgi:hypothetical protein